MTPTKTIPPRQQIKLLQQKVEQLEHLSQTQSNLIEELSKEKRQLLVELSEERHSHEAEVVTLSEQITALLDLVHTAYSQLHLHSSETPAPSAVEQLQVLCKIAIHPPPLESRMEEMESRITQQMNENIHLWKLATLYEDTLESIFHEIHVDKIHELVENSFIQSGKRRDETISKKDVVVNDPSSVKALFRNDENITFAGSCVPVRPPCPPKERLTGATSVIKMDAQLSQYICHELDQEKKSGRNWRLLGDRIGLKKDTLLQIQLEASLKKCSPTWMLLQIWSNDFGNATVRMLHRHLQSPQFGLHALAKHLSNFYLID